MLVGWQLLLVLDNCEHVIGAAAGLCKTLLAAADDVRVLATSREPLGLAGEARFRLPPLALPGDYGDDGDHDAAGAGEPEAVALFADRARLADPSAIAEPGCTRPPGPSSSARNRWAKPGKRWDPTWLRRRRTGARR